MIKNNIKEKACSNCRYYSEHYSKQDTRFRKIFCGHCINENNPYKRKKTPIQVCELWEEQSIQIEERRKSIKKTLELISDRLSEIAMILKDDTDAIVEES